MPDVPERPSLYVKIKNAKSVSVLKTKARMEFDATFHWRNVITKTFCNKKTKEIMHLTIQRQTVNSELYQPIDKSHIDHSTNYRVVAEISSDDKLVIIKDNCTFEDACIACSEFK